MSEQAFSFSVETEVTPAHYDELAKYIFENYITPMARAKNFTNISQAFEEDTSVLGFTALDLEGKWHVDVSVKTGKTIQVTMQPNNANVPKTVFERIKEDLIIAIQYFEEAVRRSTLYFAWVEGKPVVVEKSPLRRARVLERIFFGNILFLFVLMIAISLLLFIFLEATIGPDLGIYVAALVLVVGQVFLVLFGDRLIGAMAEWSITEKNPTVHILQYHLPPQELAQFREKFPREKLLQIKKDIYDQTLAVGKPIACETAREVMSKYGLESQPENMGTKRINVYQLVKKATEKFGLPMPKVGISNTMVANAAASGPSPKRGIVIITTGLLVQLEENEILTVLGHELSHLKSRDPLVLLGLVTSEYLFRIFVLVSYFPVLFTSLFGFIYVIGILGLIYFVAKFFEARADLESAIKLQNPRVLAEALRKIGFRRLQFERSSAIRVQDWITWNPHPPIYFRVARLENMGENALETKHTLFQSAKDCVKGFFAAF
jgi:heat shock protein HtpX